MRGGIGGREEGLLFSNVVINRVTVDAAAASLRLRLLYDDREYVTYLYEDVLYSQIDQSAIGSRIAYAREMTPEQLLQRPDRLSVAKLMTDCGQSSPESLTILANKEYRFLMHSSELREWIIVAKQLRKIRNTP